MIPLKVIRLITNTKNSYSVYFRWLDNIIVNVKKNKNDTYTTTIHGYRYDGDVFKITSMNDTEDQVNTLYYTKFDMLHPCVALVPIKGGKMHVILVPSDISPHDLAKQVNNMELIDDEKDFISEWFE